MGNFKGKNMIKIYFEDEHIVVCEKPYGIMSQVGNGSNMPQLLSEQLNTKIYPVHRLDTTTTGLIIYAKSEKMAGLLSTRIANGDLDKYYLAVCHGKTQEGGEMTDYLYHDKLKNKSFVVKSERKGARLARLEFCTLGGTFLNEKELSLVKIHLLTGRTHQIRVQFASRGNMLYGDGKYGAKDNDKIALHSHSLEITHPITNQKMTFTSLPEGGIWERLQSKLKSI